MKYWTGSAWSAEKPVKYWNGSAWVAKPVKYWDGSAWIQKPSVGGGAPTASLVTAFTPGNDRNDFDGEVGVRFAIGATAIPNVSWIGMYCRTPSGTRKVHLYDWAAGTKSRSVTIDMNGKTQGQWVWVAITPITLLAATYYGVMMECTASDGLVWSNPGPTTVVPALTNVAAAYRVLGDVLTVYTTDQQYVGLDLGW